MNSLQFIIAYVVIINIISFIAMGNDKRKARKHVYRTPESVLFTLALMGGSIGSIVGMYTFRHKTQHWYFVVFMPVIFIVQVAFVVAIYLSPIEIVFR